MKLFFITLLFPLITFSQQFTLEEIGDDYLFRPFSIAFTYLDEGIMTVKRNSNNLGLFIYIDSSKTSSIVQRYHETGMISMIITDFEFNIRPNDSTVAYCTSGNVKTFYPNGRLRTEYQLDSLGDVIDEIKQYSMDGKKLKSITFRNGRIWNGIHISKNNWNPPVYFISIIKKGVETHCFHYMNGLWYDNKENIIRENKTLKKIRITYYFSNNYALIFPQNINVW